MCNDSKILPMHNDFKNSKYIIREKFGCITTKRSNISLSTSCKRSFKFGYAVEFFSRTADFRSEIIAFGKVNWDFIRLSLFFSWFRSQFSNASLRIRKRGNQEQCVVCPVSVSLFVCSPNCSKQQNANETFNCAAGPPNEERRFFAFHDWGVSIYEPFTCRLYHRIQSTDIIPGTQVSRNN